MSINLNTAANCDYSSLALPSGYDFIEKYRRMDNGRGIVNLMIKALLPASNISRYLSYQNVIALLYLYENIGRTNAGTTSEKWHMLRQEFTSTHALFFALEGLRQDACPEIFSKIIDNAQDNIDYNIFGDIVCECISRVNPNTDYISLLIRFGSGKCIKAVMEKLYANAKSSYISDTLKSFSKRADYAQLCTISVQKIASEVQNTQS